MKYITCNIINIKMVNSEKMKKKKEKKEEIISQ